LHRAQKRRRHDRPHTLAAQAAPEPPRLLHPVRRERRIVGLVRAGVPARIDEVLPVAVASEEDATRAHQTGVARPGGTRIRAWNAPCTFRRQTFGGGGGAMHVKKLQLKKLSEQVIVITGAS